VWHESKETLFGLLFWDGFFIHLFLGVGRPCLYLITAPWSIPSVCETKMVLRRVTTTFACPRANIQDVTCVPTHVNANMQSNIQFQTMVDSTRQLLDPRPITPGASWTLICERTHHKERTRTT
jgi:hypothetical protein